MSSPTRRVFLGTAAAAGTLLATGVGTGSAEQQVPSEPPAPAFGRAPKPLSILILGGTGFIGPNQIRYAVERGHKVSMFNRGRTNPGLFPDVEHLEGDRNGRLDALEGRRWDAVIDNPATLPRWVRDTAQLLKDSADQYLFISTLSVYADNSVAGMDETAKLIELADPTIEEVTGESYGGLKALAEKEAERAFPGRATIVRPGLIVGAGDKSDRFNYWPVRIARGGEVLAPGNPTDPVQFIDARDLGEFTVRLVEQKAFGAFNATGPAGPFTMAEMLYGIRATTTVPTSFTWIPAEFLEAQGVGPWMDMPVWIPPVGEYAGFARRSNARALRHGLTFRPLADTAVNTLAWYESRPAEERAKPRAGITAEKEREVLEAWKKQQGNG
jgi:2'-hydroxyisoflavone reductase